MKYEVISKTSEDTIPEVGQMWKHAGFSTVYMRINDTHGANALGTENRDEKFYSVHPDGIIVNTSRKADNIEILQPVGGVIKLEVV
jgi:hypothetical protein